MKIEYNYLGDKFNNRYPYMYRIDTGSWQLHERERVLDWMGDLELPCIEVGWSIYVKDHETVVLFILRWQ